MEKIPSLTAVYGINETYIVEQLEYALNMAKGEVPLKEFFVNSHPYTAAALLHVAVMGLTFVIGTLQDEYSQVDRIWSLLPAFTIIMYTVHSYLNGIAASRLWIYTIIVVIWSVRLTYNFARKGGYTGVEDYRWQILRSKMTPLQFTVFSVTFISTAQIALLLSITSPAIIFYYSENEQIGIGDIGFAYSLLACVLVEGIADDDQWRFQKAKAEFKASGKVLEGYTKPQLERGFCTTGLFGFSRHPNFLAEQLFWVLPYLWNVHLTGKYINWTIFGAVGYVLLFQASTFFTEYISTGKYPQYAEYQKTVGRFLPGFSHWKEPFNTNCSTTPIEIPSQYPLSSSLAPSPASAATLLKQQQQQQQSSSPKPLVQSSSSSVWSTGGGSASLNPSLASGNTARPTELSKIVGAQIVVLVSTIKEDKWDATVKQIRQLCDQNGPEVYQKYFRRLVSILFSSSPSRPQENPSVRRLLIDEIGILSTNPSLSHKFADSIALPDNDVFKDFRLSPFFDNLQLDSFQKTVLCLSVRSSANQDLKVQAFDILSENFESFLSIIRDASHYSTALTEENIAVIVNQFNQEPALPFFNAESRSALYSAIVSRFAPSPPPASIAPYLQLLADSKAPMESLQKLIASLGPNVQQSIDDLAYDSKTVIAVANAAIESNLVDELTSFEPYFFTLDVFSHLARAGKYPLQKFLDQNLTNDSPAFVSAVLTFLDLKSSAEYSQQQQQQQQEEQIPEPADFLSLHVQVVHDLLHVLLSRTIPLEFVDKWEHVQAKCIQTYPRLINLGSGHDSAVLANSNETGFSAEVEKRMKYYYQRMYEQEMSISDVITLLQELKVSDDPNEQDAFACMVHSLFDEYRFFPDYPLPALATTAVLFGSIIQFHLIEDLPLAVALRFVLEALKESPDAKMFKFGLQALMQFQSRLDTFPHYCTLLLQIPSLEAVQPQLIAKLRALIMKDGNSLGGNGAIDQSIDNDAPPPPPPFRSLHLDSDSAGPSETASEDPNEDVQDKVLFIVNNLAPTNVEQKSRELKSVLEEKHYQWFATYLVDTRAKQEPNFHDLYMKMLDIVNDNHLNKQIISSTYASIISILNSSDTAISAQERGRLKNLGCWLGYLTLARDKPIKHKNIAFKDLLIEAFDTNRLTVVLPFVCKVLEMVTKSRIFKPPSPWVMGILKVMAELYQFAELKLNLKFEIEVLCNSLGVELNSLEPSTILRERPLKTEAIDNAARPAGIDVNRDFDRLSLSGYNRVDGRLSVRPSDGINIGTPSLPTSYPQVSAGGALTTHPAMKKILQTAIEKSIRELITPVVERSDTIAQIATKELTTKDFALEGDEEKLRKAAHNMVHYLASSLALVTCKEPLRINIGTNLRALLVASGYPESSFSPEVLNATINEHLDAACAVIQKAAVDKAIADIDEVLAPAYAVRRRHRELRPNQPFIEQSASRYALQLPDPFRLKPPGLTRQQLMVYEDFGKFKLGGLGPDGLQVGEFGAAVDHSGTPLASQAYLLQQQQQTQNALLGQSQNLVQQQQQSIGMAAHGQPQNRLMPVLQQQGSQQPGHQFDGQLHGPQTPTQPPVETVGGMGDIGRMSATGKMSAIEQTLASMQTAIDAMIKTIKELPDGSYEKLPADSRVKAMVNSILSVANRSPLRDQIILRTSQLTVSVLFTVADSQLAREALGYLLARLCDLSAATSKEVVLWLILSEDERKFNVPVMITLMRLGLVHPQELDLNLAKQLTAHRLPAIEFIANLIHEALLGENPCALRTDFSLCLEAMEMLASEEQPEQIAIQLIQALENAALPALPGADITEKEMMRYIFSEWVRLIQHPAQSEKLLNVFILQLAEKGILDDDKYLGVFFRNALEFCIDAYAKDLQLRMMNNAVSTKEGVISVDALAKLTVMLFKIHDEQGETRKIVYLRSILSVYALVFAQNHESQGEAFNGQPFFRLFSSIMCEFVEIGETMSEHKEEFYTLMAEIFKALQPVAFPGFTFAWMTLISHRMFMPKILQLEQKKGWKSFAELIELLLKFIGLHVVGSDLPESIRYIYKGTLRIVLVLLHDIPEFLVQYHYTLCNAVPICCVQLRNLILSAFPQSMALPDPFAQGFRIETLAECKQEPVLAVDPAEDLRTFGMLEFVNGYLRAKNASGISLKPLLEVLTTKSRTEIGLGFKTVSTNTQAMNALVLYVGQQAVAEMISKSSGEEAVVFDGKTNYVSFLTSLVLELGPEGRFFLLSAMANQLRYPNSHTFYFTSLIQHLYETAALGGQQQDIQEHIARVVLERLLCHRPHPWGLLIAQGVCRSDVRQRVPGLIE